jgi:hypothetical protein
MLILAIAITVALVFADVQDVWRSKSRRLAGPGGLQT